MHIKAISLIACVLAVGTIGFVCLRQYFNHRTRLLIDEARQSMELDLREISTKGTTEAEIARLLAAKQIPSAAEQLTPDLRKYHGEAFRIIETSSHKIAAPLSTCVVHVEFR